MNIEDFFTKGFTYTNDSEVFKPIESVFDHIVWYKNPAKQDVLYTEKNKHLQQALDSTMNLLGEKYVSMLSPKFSTGYCDMWNGVDDGTDKWHNDGREGPNLFFILYFNSMNESIGGGIGFRETQTKKQTGFIWPQKYDVLMGSQRPQYEHLVEHLNKPIERTVANFGFSVEGF